MNCVFNNLKNSQDSKDFNVLSLYTLSRLGLPTRSFKETGGFCFIDFTIAILVSLLTFDNKNNDTCLGERYQVWKFSFCKQAVDKASI